MTGTCSRCGRVGEVEYGTDGLPYCSSCSFYAYNKQCWRCRMYVPATELQQYRGQLTCPNCIQDLRQEDRKSSEYHEEKHKLEIVQYPEQCERCGRDLEGRVYIWNGKKLCKKCVGEEQEAHWSLVGGGPSHAPQRITLKPEEDRIKKSALENTISETLIFLHLKKRPVREAYIYDTKMPIQYAKPMAEKPIESKSVTQRPKPQAEGIIKEEQSQKPEDKTPPLDIQKPQEPLSPEKEKETEKPPQVESASQSAKKNVQGKKRQSKKSQQGEKKKKADEMMGSTSAKTDSEQGE